MPRSVAPRAWPVTTKRAAGPVFWTVKVSLRLDSGATGNSDNIATPLVLNAIWTGCARNVSGERRCTVAPDASVAVIITANGTDGNGTGPTKLRVTQSSSLSARI